MSPRHLSHVDVTWSFALSLAFFPDIARFFRTKVSRKALKSRTEPKEWWREQVDELWIKNRKLSSFLTSMMLQPHEDKLMSTLHKHHRHPCNLQVAPTTDLCHLHEVINVVKVVCRREGQALGRPLSPAKGRNCASLWQIKATTSAFLVRVRVPECGAHHHYCQPWLPAANDTWGWVQVDRSVSPQLWLHKDWVKGSTYGCSVPSPAVNVYPLCYRVSRGGSWGRVTTT